MTFKTKVMLGKGAGCFGRLVVYILISAGAIAMLFPFAWMVSTSLKGRTNLFVYPPQLIPNLPWQWNNFREVFTRLPMALGFLNSAKIAIINTFGTLFSATMAAFGFAKLRFRFRNQLFMVLLATMMIPGQVTLIPMFVWFKNLNWIDTHLPLIVPAILCNAYGVFLLRQFFMTIPDSYAESAKIDGASYLTIFFRIMLPLCVPAMATLGVFSFMGNWNNFLTPLIYINSRAKFTIPLFLMAFQNGYTRNWNLLMAAATVSVLPIIIIYIFAQRYFIEGVVLSGVKG
ncbi:MAG: carbohydrate ABC transporter permease [Treponema sp.]|jgi:multiple sugar transport system permease protein|nr:carbohydrate ABC transporter permease [Treponema sp.]